MSSQRINVYIRVRPTIKEDVALADGDDIQMKDCVYIDKSRRILTIQPQARFLSERRSFKFNHIFPPSVGQREVFETTGLPILYDALSGLNCCLLCFGQTGSGKTHSLFSSNFSNNRFDFSQEEQSHLGIIPRISQTLFEEISESTTIKVSFTQLYCGKFRDLINPSKKNLNIREKRNNLYIENLTERRVKSAEELLELVEESSNNRIIANTRMNLNSSRSHVLFIIKIVQKRGSKIVRSKLTLVDLAGNEKLRKTKSKGKRLKECQFINKSLQTLGLCINSLILRDKRVVEDSKLKLNNTMPSLGSGRRGRKKTYGGGKKMKKIHVPFRDSKLTRILTDSLNGKSRCSILCTLSTPFQHYEESLSTLFFALRAQCIRVKPKINEQQTENTQNLTKRVNGLEKENQILHQKNTELQKDNHLLKKKITERRQREVALKRVVKRYESSRGSPKNSFNNTLTLPGKKSNNTSSSSMNLNVNQSGVLDEGTFENLVEVFSKSRVFKEKFLEKVIGSPPPPTHTRSFSYLSKSPQSSPENDNSKSPHINMHMETQRQRRKKSNIKKKRGFSPIKKREQFEKERIKRHQMFQRLYDSTDIDNLSIMKENEMGSGNNSNVIDFSPIQEIKKTKKNIPKRSSKRILKLEEKDQDKWTKELKVIEPLGRTKKKKKDSIISKGIVSDEIIEENWNDNFLEEYEKLQKEHEEKLKEIEKSEKQLLERRVKREKETKRKEDDDDDDISVEKITSFSEIQEKYTEVEGGLGLQLKELEKVTDDFDFDQDQLDLVERRWKKRMERLMNKKLIKEY